MTTDNRTNEQLSGNPGQFTEAQVEAAARAIADNLFSRWTLTSRVSASKDRGSLIHVSARAALVAAASVAPVVQRVSESDALALVDEVLAIHADRIGTHYEDCYKYHVACLAVAVKHRLGGEGR